MSNQQATGQRIREARLAAGLKQGDLAKLIGVTQSSLSLKESGQRSFGADEIGEFAKALNRPHSYFVGNADDSYVIARDSDLGRLVRFVESRPELASRIYQYGRFLQAESMFGTIGEDATEALPTS